MLSIDGIHRLDYELILEMIEPGSRVFDLGCGAGDLLDLLTCERDVKAQGIEIDNAAVIACVQKGLSVLHGDLDSGLTDYPDFSFDYVILNQCLHEVRSFEFVFRESLRVGHKVIIGFPNYAHISRRLGLLLRGETPVVDAPARHWYDTQNLRTSSIRDFQSYCRDRSISILRSYYLGSKGMVNFLPNLRARDALFLVTR